MRKLFSFIIITIYFISSALANSTNELTNYSVADNSKTYSRFVVDVVSKPNYKSYMLVKPDRFVLDIKETSLSENLPKYKSNNLIKSVRYYEKETISQIVLDLSDKPNKTKISTIEPATNNGTYKIIVEINPVQTKEIIVKLKPKLDQEQNKKEIDQYTKNNIDEELKVVDEIMQRLKKEEEASKKSTEQKIDPVNENTANKENQEKYIDEIIVRLKETVLLESKESESSKSKDKNTFPSPVTIVKIPTPVFRPRYKPMIVIDAGHGGRDPGAVSPRNTFEKDITLAYSKELKQQLQLSNKYDVLMIREKDVYLRLRERLNKARSVSGDLFISLHADSHKKTGVRGFSVYTLSETASDIEAAELAKKENKAGLISGVNLNDETDELTNLLISMTQRQTKNISAIFAETIVSTMQGNITLLRKPHRFAGFRVLTGADIPSVLIELGYLTNKKEEKLLKSTKYKKKLVSYIVKSINTHFDNN